MLNAIRKDDPSVSEQGHPLNELPDGVSFKEVTIHIDERGSVVELFDSRWSWHPDPLVFSYCFTIRPGKVKGWGMHKLHEDRYFTLIGEMLVVMYDARENSPTFGLVSKVVLSEFNKRLMNIPTGIWHANQNLGNKDAVIINFPTTPYEHSNPDKYRLPLDTNEIPYKFEDLSGW